MNTHSSSGIPSAIDGQLNPIDLSKIFREVESSEAGQTIISSPEYTGLYDDRIWRLIFVAVFDSQPTDDNDPRWDMLFSKNGHNALSRYNKYRDEK